MKISCTKPRVGISIRLFLSSKCISVFALFKQQSTSLIQSPGSKAQIFCLSIECFVHSKKLLIETPQATSSSSQGRCRKKVPSVSDNKTPPNPHPSIHPIVKFPYTSPSLVVSSQAKANNCTNSPIHPTQSTIIRIYNLHYLLRHRAPSPLFHSSCVYSSQTQQNPNSNSQG